MIPGRQAGGGLCGGTLCRRCHADPDLRRRYQSDGLSDQEILALPPQPGDEEPPPPPYEPPPEESRSLGDFANQWSGIADCWEITEETSPAAIAEAQRRDVAEAYRRVGPDPAAIAAVVDLPVWSVERRLEELGLRS